MTSTTATDTLTANKRLAVRFLDLISDGDIAGLTALISPTWTMEGGPPDLPAGRDGLRVLRPHRRACGRGGRSTRPQAGRRDRRAPRDRAGAGAAARPSGR